MCARAFFFFSLFLCTFALSTSNNRPIIGILSVPLHGSGNPYIPASYVKFLEMGGSRVVPLVHTRSTEELDSLFYSLNGILFTGGGANLNHSSYRRSAEHLVNRVIESNDRGNHIPLFAICLGFESLTTIIAEKQGGSPVLHRCGGAENISMNLVMTSKAKTSKLLGSLTDLSFNTLSQQKVTINNHGWCLMQATWEASRQLTDFFDVLSTNADDMGFPFISTIEAKKYPIFATQWHPEKNVYEWKANEDINHSMAAVRPIQELSLFYVNEARKNNRHFQTIEKERASLIYNYCPKYTAAHSESTFDQIYEFTS